MISSTSCSSAPPRAGARAAPRFVGAAAALAALAACALAAGCAAPRQGAPARPATPAARIAVLPPDNVSGGPVPVGALGSALEYALARRGIEVVSGQAVDLFLAEHRLRKTGGLDAETARAAGEQLGVDGVLVTSVELYSASPARLAVTSRLVAAERSAEIRWIDGVARAGTDTKTFLGLGVVDRIERLRDQAAATLARSLARHLSGEGPRAPPCAAPGSLGPKTWFRAPDLGAARPLSIAVLPFANDTSRNGAGEAVMLSVVRRLAAVENLRVLEPGIVRRELLRFRMIFEHGVSLEHARLVTDPLEADLVVAGEVRELSDSGVPRTNFSVMVLERSSRRIVWNSTSYAGGDDRVVLFDLGRISTASALACGMAQNVVEKMGFAGRRGLKAPPDPALAAERRRSFIGYASPTQSLRTASGSEESK